MHAYVDPSLCTGCGPCESICPNVFEVKDGVAMVRVDPVPPEDEEDCQEAADSCPTGAITLAE